MERNIKYVILRNYSIETSVNSNAYDLSQAARSPDILEEIFNEID